MTLPAPAADPNEFPPVRVPSRASVVAAVGGVLLLVVLLAFARAMPVFVIGLVLGYVIDAPVTALAQRGVPRWFATILMIVATALIALLVLAVVVGTIVREGAAFIGVTVEALMNIESWIAGLALPQPLRQALLEALAEVVSGVASIDLAALVGPIARALLGLLNSAVGTLTLAFFVFFVVKDRPKLARSLVERLPARWKPDLVAIMRLVTRQFGTYVRSEAVLVAAIGLLTWIGLILLGFLVDPRLHNVALLLALIAAVAELIPLIGPWIAGIPAVVVALGFSPGAAVAVLVLYVVVSFLEGNVLGPTLQGKSFEIHPAIVAPLILGGLTLFGPLGAILALPIAGAARDVFTFVFRRAAGTIKPPPLAGDFVAPEPQPVPVPRATLRAE